MKGFFALVSCRRNGRWLQEAIVEKSTQKIVSGMVSFCFYSTDDCSAHFFKQMRIEPVLVSNLPTAIVPLAIEIKSEIETLAENLRHLRRSLPIFKSKIDWYDANY